MSTEVFNRYESKYLMDSNTFHTFENSIKQYMELDAYNKKHDFYTVANLYCDTDDYRLIRTSIEKPLYKEKLRLRTYGVPKPDSLVYCEIKKKFKGKVNKRRSRLALSEAYDFIGDKPISEIKPFMNPLVLSEIDYMLKRYQSLKPKVYIAYERRAYFDKNDKELRISFDTNIRFRQNQLSFEAGTHGTPLLDKDVWLMEIKCFNMPMWLAQLLSSLKIYPRSFSKYGNIYKNHISRQITNSIREDLQLSEVATTFTSQTASAQAINNQPVAF